MPTTCEPELWGLFARREGVYRTLSSSWGTIKDRPTEVPMPTLAKSLFIQSPLPKPKLRRRRTPFLHLPSPAHRNTSRTSDMEAFVLANDATPSYTGQTALPAAVKRGSLLTLSSHEWSMLGGGGRLKPCRCVFASITTTTRFHSMGASEPMSDCFILGHLCTIDFSAVYGVVALATLFFSAVTLHLCTIDFSALYGTVVLTTYSSQPSYLARDYHLPSSLVASASAPSTSQLYMGSSCSQPPSMSSKC